MAMFVFSNMQEFAMIGASKDYFYMSSISQQLYRLDWLVATL